MRFLFLLLILPTAATCQTIVNAAMVGPNGVTKDPKEAQYLIVVKKYSDTAYTRIEYNFSGPMIKSTTYRDPKLTEKNGPFRQYNSNGQVEFMGNYYQNQKNGDWYQYSEDSLKIIEKDRYNMDQVVYKWGLDSMHIHDSLAYAKTKARFGGKPKEVEASFPGGDKAWAAHVYKDATFPERAMKLSVGGTVIAMFVVDTLGRVVNPDIEKSVEFSLDEEVLTLLDKSKSIAWVPAYQGDHHVKAFRRQKFTFTLPK
jgi:hypothetical protein